MSSTSVKIGKVNIAVWFIAVADAPATCCPIAEEDVLGVCLAQHCTDLKRPVFHSFSN
jgi:hypothetical protein